MVALLNPVWVGGLRYVSLSALRMVRLGLLGCVYTHARRIISVDDISLYPWEILPGVLKTLNCDI